MHPKMQINPHPEEAVDIKFECILISATVNL